MAKKTTKKQAERWRNRIVGTGEKPAIEFVANIRNWRIHPKEQRAALRGVLGEVGWVQGVLENVRTGNLIDGHARIEEALKLGDDTPVPYTQVDLSEEEEATILASFDPISAMAVADKEQLDALLREVETADAAVMQMLDDLAKSNGLDYGKEGASDADTEPQIDKADELRVKWGVERGQVWQLGDHRLMCGDSTSAEDVTRLMGDKVPAMIFADPPYGVSIVSGLGSVGAAKPFGSKDVRGPNVSANIVDVGKYAPIIGDETTDTAKKSVGMLLEKYPKAVHVWWGANYYTEALKPSACWLVWNKETTGNFADCELAWTNQDKAAKLFTHKWNGMLRESERSKRMHPTQKPAALAKWTYEQFNTAGLVFDPFCGCGPSIIAGEHHGAFVYGIEMSADYAAVILQRWADATGKTPALIE